MAYFMGKPELARLIEIKTKQKTTEEDIFDIIPCGKGMLAIMREEGVKHFFHSNYLQKVFDSSQKKLS